MTLARPPAPICTLLTAALWIVVLLFAVRPTAARQLLHGQLDYMKAQPASVPGAVGSRQLRQSARCPEGCDPNGCIQAGTGGALRCNKCTSNLVLNTATGLCGEFEWCCCHGGYLMSQACPIRHSVTWHNSTIPGPQPLLLSYCVVAHSRCFKNKDVRLEF